MTGRNQQEDVVGMLAQYPLMNEYWKDKRAKIEDIQVPAYVLASYSSGLHTVGSFRGFEDIPHQNKWYVAPSLVFLIIFAILRILIVPGCEFIRPLNGTTYTSRK